MTAGECREYAGLSLGQAAKILGVDSPVLADIEAGCVVPDGCLVRAMGKAYGARCVLPERAS